MGYVPNSCRYDFAGYRKYLGGPIIICRDYLNYFGGNPYFFAKLFGKVISFVVSL